MKWATVVILLAGCTAPLIGPAHQGAAPADRAPSAATRPEGIPQALARGVAFLVKSQNPDGSWGTGTETRGFEVYSMVPGSHDAFRVATTALCVMALREAGEKAAHARGLEYLLVHGEVRRDQGDMMYNTWAHIYALQALAIEMRTSHDPRLAAAAAWQVDRLVRYETYMGGWNYYDFGIHTQVPSEGPTSFGAAAGLVALWEARQSGIVVPQKLIDRALHKLTEMHLPNGAYLYGDYLRYLPRHQANLPRGSVGRTQACNYALWLWKAGNIGEIDVRAGLAMFEIEHDYIQMGRKRPVPHDSWYKTAPYYYYFGHYYAARLIEKLEGEQKRHHAAVILDGVLPYQEADGSWWDFAMWDYHKPYGTAFAIMTLLRCG